MLCILFVYLPVCFVPLVLVQYTTSATNYKSNLPANPTSRQQCFDVNNNYLWRRGFANSKETLVVREDQDCAHPMKRSLDIGKVLNWSVGDVNDAISLLQEDKQ